MDRDASTRGRLYVNDGRFIATVAIDAVAKAMEHLTDPEQARLVGVQVMTVWETPDGLRMIGQTAEAPA